MSDPVDPTAIAALPCACMHQCGRPHTQGTKRVPGPCGKFPSFATRNVAAAADPSAPVTVGAQLVPFCPDCYTSAVRRGHEARAQARAQEAQRAQGDLF